MDDMEYVEQDMGYEMLPCELKIGEFAYVKADTTFHKGGESNAHSILFEDIKECKKISRQEAEELIDISRMNSD